MGNANQLFKSGQHQAHRIAYYIRVSTEEQAENPEGSIKNQEERLKAAVNLKNMESNFGEVVGVFIDRAKSGKDTNRSELQRLLKAIRQKEVTLVMVSELSRLSRSIKDFSEIWELMQANSCGFLSLRESFDTTTAAGEMVLYTVANIAQFERRQTAERVSANVQSRASRGLYNGGVIPLGYKLIPEKRGYLAIDEEQAEIVRHAFKMFLSEGTLTKAATALNSKGYRYQRKMQGGGSNSRLGLFTVDNLHNILRNKSYIGVRIYKTKNGLKESKAVWEPIIDEVTFNAVQDQLTANHRRKKPDSENRYPYLLSGICFCGICKDRLVGKSANGSTTKVAYYEHGWATKRQSCLVKKVFECQPHRIPASKLEPLVWQKVEALLATPEIAKALILEAKKIHESSSQHLEGDRVKTKLKAIDSQIEALAERLAEMPKHLTAAPVYKQMDKLEAIKKVEQEKLNALSSSPQFHDLPATLASYEAFRASLDAMAKDQATTTPLEALRRQIIQKLIHKIEIKPDGVTLHYYVGQNHIDREPALAGSRLFLCPKPKKITMSERPKKSGGPHESGTAAFFAFSSSNTLTSGGPIRT